MSSIEVQDHLGNTFPSIAAMCRAYGLHERANYYHRIKHGWSLEKTLTMPVIQAKFPVVYNGRTYESYNAFTRATGVSRRSLLRRKAMGFNADEAVEMSRQGKWLGMFCKDHLGTKYPSMSAMCRAWHRHIDVVRKRLDRGASIEEALTAERYPEPKGRKKHG